MTGVKGLLTDRKTMRGIARLLGVAASIGPRHRSTARPSKPRRVVHVSPSLFAEESLIGGGERFALGLAEGMSDLVETVLVSFGRERRTTFKNKLRIEQYKFLDLIDGVIFDPISFGFLRELLHADVIHSHHYRTYVSSLAILFGAAIRKPVFVSDHGAGGFHLVEEMALWNFVDAFLADSAFSAERLVPRRGVELIYGGVDSRFLSSSAQTRKRQVLFVGRLLPHKGVNYLIEAVDDDLPLLILGRPYNPEYFELLMKLAEGKQVEFVVDASDDDVIDAYRSSSVTVLPSVYEDVYGASYEMPEALGLTLLESLAAGTPVICSAVGGMPEIVTDGVTGFVVPPNDPQALRSAIARMLADSELAGSMGSRGREMVISDFTWGAVASKCLKAYSTVWSERHLVRTSN